MLHSACDCYLPCRRISTVVLLGAVFCLGQAVETVKPPEYGNRPTPTQQPSETPKTAPQVKPVLPSYEGRQVTSVELARQPDVDAAALTPLLQQRAGPPFSQAQVDVSIASLTRAGRYHDVTLEVRPEADGIRVLFNSVPGGCYRRRKTGPGKHHGWSWKTY
ncbi:MAG: hypothetical protein LAO06_21120 [Acidobacteriia bacterium]|nr:hypothetical protein [Terriglobia bacterium]